MKFDEKHFEKIRNKIVNIEEKLSDFQSELGYTDDCIENFIAKDNIFKGMKKKQKQELADKILLEEYPNFHKLLKPLDKFCQLMQESLQERLDKLEELQDKLNDIESLQEEVESMKDNL